MSKEKYNTTFILHLQFRRNKSWQGTIKWVESKKAIQFRSALELIKIIASTCRSYRGTEEEDLDVLMWEAAGNNCNDASG